MRRQGEAATARWLPHLRTPSKPTWRRNPAPRRPQAPPPRTGRKAPGAHVRTAGTAYQRAPGFDLFGRLAVRSPAFRRSECIRAQTQTAQRRGSKRGTPNPADAGTGPWAPNPHALRSRDHADPGGGETRSECWQKRTHESRCCCSCGRCCRCATTRRSRWNCCSTTRRGTRRRSRPVPRPRVAPAASTAACADAIVATQCSSFAYPAAPVKPATRWG